MKTTIIPAQVTTVEDMIAGNFNLTQIVLLVSSLFINTFIYALVSPQLSLNVFKMTLFILVFAICCILAFRFKQRLILHWLFILATYILRPHLYVFNKNNAFARPVIHEKKAHHKPLLSILPKRKQQTNVFPQFDYQQLSRNTSMNVEFKRNGKLIIKNYV